MKTMASIEYFDTPRESVKKPLDMQIWTPRDVPGLEILTRLSVYKATDVQFISVRKEERARD